MLNITRATTETNSIHRADCQPSLKNWNMAMQKLRSVIHSQAISSVLIIGLFINGDSSFNVEDLIFRKILVSLETVSEDNLVPGGNFYELVADQFFLSFI